MRRGANISREANVFFSRLAEKALPGDPAVERAVAMFEAANGAIRIATICEEVGLSPRQLNRRFTHIVGVGPKFFGQILQINWVVALLYFNDTATLTEIAHEAGFYDQAHFNRAMRLFFSEGPREFLRSNHLLFKTFLGASRRLVRPRPWTGDGVCRGAGTAAFRDATAPSPGSERRFRLARNEPSVTG